jgi:hypothetical protein
MTYFHRADALFAFACLLSEWLVGDQIAGGEDDSTQPQ